MYQYGRKYTLQCFAYPRTFIVFVKLINASLLKGSLKNSNFSTKLLAIKVSYVGIEKSIQECLWLGLGF